MSRRENTVSETARSRLAPRTRSRLHIRCLRPRHCKDWQALIYSRETAVQIFIADMLKFCVGEVTDEAHYNSFVVPG